MSEVFLMAAHSRWLDCYNSALHACGNRNHQERKAEVAIRACVERLWEMDLAETAGQEEIHAALADLSLLQILYRKYT
jgi:hypothetical protein